MSGYETSRKQFASVKPYKRPAMKKKIIAGKLQNRLGINPVGARALASAQVTSRKMSKKKFL